MNKTKSRCLSLAMAIVGVLVIGSGVALGQTGTGLGPAITCSTSVMQGATEGTGVGQYQCFFTVINGGEPLDDNLVVTVNTCGIASPCPVAVSCFDPVSGLPVTDLGGALEANNQCVGDLVTGTIPFSCSATNVVLSFEVFAAATAGGPLNEAGGGNTRTITILGINCADTDACTVDSCVQGTGAGAGCVNTPDPLACLIDGRMTGGGSIFTPSLQRVTHGFELHCDEADLPNNLQINWGGNRFHLELLETATCTDDTEIDQRPPGHSPFDTFIGTGTGTCNGVTGATISFTFVDAGEPGKNDLANIVIDCPTGIDDLSVSGSLKKGNHQAHRNN